MKNNSHWITIGFLLFFLGITSLVLQMVNVHWVFLRWLEWRGGLLSLVIKITIMILGIVLYVIGRTDWEQEKAESS